MKSTYRVLYEPIPAANSVFVTPQRLIVIEDVLAVGARKLAPMSLADMPHHFVPGVDCDVTLTALARVVGPHLPKVSLEAQGLLESHSAGQAHRLFGPVDFVHRVLRLVVVLQSLLVVQNVVAEPAQERKHCLLPGLVAMLHCVSVGLQSGPGKFKALKAREGSATHMIRHLPF